MFICSYVTLAHSSCQQENRMFYAVFSQNIRRNTRPAAKPYVFRYVFQKHTVKHPVPATHTKTAPPKGRGLMIVSSEETSEIILQKP